MGATNKSAGLSGLVPAPKMNEIDLFLKSDGTWALPTINHFILTIENINASTHSDLIQETVDNIDNQSGDIIIIKDKINNNKWQYTAYVFDNNKWYAMDGNYNAENVYFKEDLITTTEIGNISLFNGKGVIAAAGKNLKEVFETIFVKEEYPETTEPSISLKFNNQKCEVGTRIIPTYSIALDPGAYTFGPNTGITASSCLITDTIGNTSSLKEGNFPEIIVDDSEYTINAVISYNDGNIPATNLGKQYPEGQIKANLITAISNPIVGYRNTFYGTQVKKSELTSNIIRGLTHYNKALTPDTSVKVNLPKGAMQMVFAYPSFLPDLVSITDTNAFNTNILNSFKKSIIQIEGNNNYSPIDYKVYTIDFAKPYSTSNYYTFTLGKEE